MTADLFRALGVMAEPPNDGTAVVADALGLSRSPRPEEFTDLFVMLLSPYASVYLGADGMLGGEARDRVAGFWRALGMTPPAEADHLAALLGLYASLSEPPGEDDHREQRERAREALLWEHLSSWLPPYLERVREIAPAPYAEWATVLGEAIAAEQVRTTPPPVLPLHLREAPLLPDLMEGTLDDVIAALLVPVKTGMILTKYDLAKLAKEVGLGLRQGERRFILRALIDQDPAGVLDWLEVEARRRIRSDTDPITLFWSDRAARAEHMLRTMRHGVEETRVGFAGG